MGWLVSEDRLLQAADYVVREMAESPGSLGWWSAPSVKSQ
jgi:hypothetical protein